MLFIQGVGVHGSGWTPQIDGLAGRYQCVSFDNRGLGLSQPQGCAVTVEQMAEDATAILDALGVSSAHVVGHSLGGLVSLHLALTSRARVRSLALLCSFARGRAATRLSTVLLTGLRTKIGPKRQRRRAFLELVMPRHVLESARRDELAERLAPIFGHDLGVQPPITLTQVSAMRAYDAGPRLAELAGLPTLVVSAAHDRIALPAAGRAMASAIPGARYVELSDAAHGATIQSAAVLNPLLADHFAGKSLTARREAGCVAADHADDK